MTINHNMMISKRRNGDMISTLPDDVICHILSFLETKYAFRTSVLSTRWKNLFSLVPVLSFNEPYVKLGREKNHDKFINFVYKMLLTYKLTDMQSFVVDYNFFKALNSHIHGWVSAAIICNVRALRLSIDTDKLVQLPRDLCNSKTLVELILEGYFTLNLDNSMCLPGLKKLYLDHGHIRIEGSKNLSLSIFPVLEDLVFDCVFDPGVSFDISIFSLKKLTLRTYAVVPNIVLNTPALEVLDILGGIANISGNVLVSLFKARFGILTPFENVNGFHNLIKMCSNVHNLYLYDHAMEALGDYELTRFQNLTRLKIELTNNRNTEWKLLPILLESSPNLQILNFKVEEYHPQEYVEMEHLLDIRDCEISSMHLKELQVRNFTGHENEFKLVECILKNVKALNKVIIRSRKPLESEKLIIQRLIAFPRCSEDCQFMVIDNSRKMLKKIVSL